MQLLHRLTAACIHCSGCADVSLRSTPFCLLLLTSACLHTTNMPQAENNKGIAVHAFVRCCRIDFLEGLSDVQSFLCMCSACAVAQYACCYWPQLVYTLLTRYRLKQQMQCSVCFVRPCRTNLLQGISSVQSFLYMCSACAPAQYACCY